MKEAFLVFAGGGAGSVLRWLVGKSALYSPAASLPWHTFAVNIAGSFLLGILLGFFVLQPSEENHNWRLLFGGGFCGGFTTFSTFAYENVQLLQNNQLPAFFLYTFGCLVAGLLAVAAGIYLAKVFV